MIFVEISDSYRAQINANLLVKAAQATLEYEKTSPDTDVTILISDDNQLQQLNLEFLHVNAPTDVLSFQGGYSDPETGHPYLGDVAISFPQAKSQASVAGHSIEIEIQLLIVHGILHLLDYDHAEHDAKIKMWSAQADILAQLGYSIDLP